MFVFPAGCEVEEVTAGAGFNPAPAVTSSTSQPAGKTEFILFRAKFGMLHNETFTKEDTLNVLPSYRALVVVYTSFCYRLGSIMITLIKKELSCGKLESRKTRGGSK